MTMRSKITAIVTSYNYARFLREAIDSLLSQSRIPDEILLVDDGSSDDTRQIMMSYISDSPELIRGVFHDENKGIVDTFSEAVDCSTGDYVVFLGGDNIMTSNYVEECERTLSSADDIAIAYTDYILFGERAESEFLAHRKEWRADSTAQGGQFRICFPEWRGESSLDTLKEQNFIHGSSMYRKQAYCEVGGYKNEGVEDHNLFLRILSTGHWKAKKAVDTVLLYRQHSEEQANIKARQKAKADAYDGVIEHWQRDVAELRHDIDFYKSRVQELEAELKKYESGRYCFWMALKRLWHREE